MEREGELTWEELLASEDPSAPSKIPGSFQIYWLYSTAQWYDLVAQGTL